MKTMPKAWKEWQWPKWSSLQPPSDHQGGSSDGYAGGNDDSYKNNIGCGAYARMHPPTVARSRHAIKAKVEMVQQKKKILYIYNNIYVRVYVYR